MGSLSRVSPRGYEINFGGAVEGQCEGKYADW